MHAADTRTAPFPQVERIAAEMGAEEGQVGRAFPPPAPGETWRQLLGALEGLHPHERRWVGAATSVGQTGHTLLLDSKGAVYSLGGENVDGRLGHGDTVPRLMPHAVARVPRAAAVGCGGMARPATLAGSEPLPGSGVKDVALPHSR